jgi:hypothetical protein
MPEVSKRETKIYASITVECSLKGFKGFSIKSGCGKLTLVGLRFHLEGSLLSPNIISYFWFHKNFHCLGQL